MRAKSNNLPEKLIFTLYLTVIVCVAGGFTSCSVLADGNRTKDILLVGFGVTMLGCFAVMIGAILWDIWSSE